MTLTELQIERLGKLTAEMGIAAEAMNKESIEDRSLQELISVCSGVQELLRKNKGILIELRQNEAQWRDDIWRERMPFSPKIESLIKDNYNFWLQQQLRFVRDLAPRLAALGSPLEEVADAEIDLYLVEKLLQEWKSPRRAVLAALRQKVLTDEQMKALEKRIAFYKTQPSRTQLYKEAPIYDPNNPVVPEGN